MVKKDKNKLLLSIKNNQKIIARIDPITQTSRFNSKNIDLEQIKKEYIEVCKNLELTLNETRILNKFEDINKFIKKKYTLHKFTPTIVSSKMKKRRLNRRTKFNLELIKNTVEKLKNSNNLSCIEVQNHLRSIINENIPSISTINLLLHSFGYRYKTPNNLSTILNSQLTFDRKAYFYSNFFKLFEPGTVILNFDECYVGGKQNKGKKWQLNDDKCHPNGKFFFPTGSVLFIDDYNGFYHYNILQKKNTSLDIIAFFENVIQKLLANEKYKIAYNSKKIFIHLDNAKTHRSKVFFEYIESTNFQLVYSVPYEPRTQPAELIFSYLKQNIRRNKITTFNQHLNIIQDILNNIPKQLHLKNTNHCLKFIVEDLEKMKDKKRQLSNNK